MPAEANWYHAAQDSVSRAEGKSAVGLVAYMTGENLRDERTGTWCKRNHDGEVLAWGSVAPSGAAAWLTDPECLGRAWNAVEASETRINSHVAEHWNVAGKNGFTDKQHMDCAYEIAAGLSKRYGVLVTWGIHKPTDHGDDRNWHYHFGFNMRKVVGETFGAKVREIVDKKTQTVETIAVRKLVADVTNKHLAANGFDESVSHLSHRARGIDQEPTRHRGHKANQLELKGVATEVGDHNRAVRQLNAEKEASNSRLMTLQSEIIYIETPKRKKRMAQDEQATLVTQKREIAGLLREYETSLKDARWTTEEADRFAQQVESDRAHAEEEKKKEQASKTEDHDIRSPRERYLESLGEHRGSLNTFDMLSSAAKIEAAKIGQEHDRLTRQAMQTKDPDKKTDLLLVRDIQHAEYMADVSERIAHMKRFNEGRVPRREYDEQAYWAAQTSPDRSEAPQPMKLRSELQMEDSNRWTADADRLRQELRERRELAEDRQLAAITNKVDEIMLDKREGRLGLPEHRYEAMNAQHASVNNLSERQADLNRRYDPNWDRPAPEQTDARQATGREEARGDTTTLREITDRLQSTTAEPEMTDAKAAKLAALATLSATTEQEAQQDLGRSRGNSL